MDEELRFHLSERIEDLKARGRSSAQAEAEALERFGILEQSRRELKQSARTREDVLTMLERMNAIGADIAAAVRPLARAPGLCAAIVMTYALGIGVNASMVSVVDRLLLRPPPGVRDPARVAVLSYAFDSDPAGTRRQSFSYPAYAAIRDADQFANVGVFSHAFDASLGRGEHARNASGQLANAGYFAALGVAAALGRVIQPDDDTPPSGRNVVVISHGLWLRDFGGDPTVLGRSLVVGARPFTIVGVTRRGFAGLGIRPVDLWIPVAAAPELRSAGSNWRNEAGTTWLRIVVRLEPETLLPNAAARSVPQLRTSLPERWSNSRVTLEGKDLSRGQALADSEDARIPLLVAAVSLLVLLVGSVNVANMLLVNGLRRQRESAIRLALGINRHRLIRQRVLEAVVLSMLGALAALLIVPQASALLQSTLFAELGDVGSLRDHRLLAYIALVSIPLGFLTGLFAAVQTGATDLVRDLRSGARAGTRRSSIRVGLLVSQTAMVTLLLIGAQLFARSLQRVANAPLGFEPDQLVLVQMNLRASGMTPLERRHALQAIKARLASAPGVERTSLALTVPFWSSYGASISIPGRVLPPDASVTLNAVEPEFFATMGTRVIRGRPFAESDTRTESVVILDETAARQVFGGLDAIGQCVRLGDDASPCATVVGVVEQVRSRNLTGGDDEAQAYVPLNERGDRTRVLIVRAASADAPALARQLATLAQTATEGLPHVDVRAFTEIPDLAAALRPWRLGAVMFTLFGLLALLLAAIGLYAVVSQHATIRVPEMSVRLALGASTGSITAMILHHGVVPAAIGAGCGVLVATAASGWVAPLLFETSPRDLTVLVSTLVTILVAAALACLAPAFRAARTDPMLALRSD